MKEDFIVRYSLPETLNALKLNSISFTLTHINTILRLIIALNEELSSFYLKENQVKSMKPENSLNKGIFLAPSIARHTYNKDFLTHIIQYAFSFIVSLSTPSLNTLPKAVVMQ